MERTHSCCSGGRYRHRKRIQQKVIHLIVDDPASSNPHSLLHWLKRQMRTFSPVNNPDYNPTLPAA